LLWSIVSSLATTEPSWSPPTTRRRLGGGGSERGHHLTSAL
jgi:hypothetical protein